MTHFDQPAGPDAGEILRAVGEATYEWYADGDTLTWSANAAAVLSIGDVGAISSGKGYAQTIATEPGQGRAELMAKAGRDGGEGVSFQIQYALKRADKTTWLEETGRWFAGADGKPQRAIGVVRDITERHEHERKLNELARFDSLTGELNRAALLETLGGALDEAVRFRGSCGFLTVAIDHLGRLNESYGFETTDEVIVQVAKRLRARLRGKDYLGRLSGNKFGVVLTACTPDELGVAAERLLAGVRDDPIATVAGTVVVTVTIGGVTAPRHARSVPEILSRAQDALHVARHRRHGSFVAYKPSVERDALRRESLRATDEIVAALNDRRIGLAYEPVAETDSRRVAFYECLMRIDRSDGSMAHANEIVPVAERLGLVRMLDHRVLELVVSELAAAPGLVASVNVSPASAVDPDWWNGLDALLRADQNVAERLIVEITETAAIQNVEEACSFVARVKELGCRIAIDDFGAGHTSFRNLRRLGVDIVKIDGAFVQNLAASSDDRAFVQTLIDLGHRLGLKTVAEWVQDEEAAALAATWGCDFLQGKLIGLATRERPWAATMDKAASA